MTSYLLYALAQLGFKVDILRYGMNVVMDVLNLSVEIHDAANGDRAASVVGLSEPVCMEG